MALRDKRVGYFLRLLVKTGTLLVVPSMGYLCLAMAGLVRADVFSVGRTSGLRMIAATAVVGCLMAAVGYWDDYERS